MECFRMVLHTNIKLLLQFDTISDLRQLNTDVFVKKSNNDKLLKKKKVLDY